MRGLFLRAFALVPLAAVPVSGQSIISDPSAGVSAASPNKGSALVTADSGACAWSSTLTLSTVTRRVTAAGRPGISRSAVATSGVGGACRWRIDGLDPGEYEVGLVGEGGSGGAVEFTAVPGMLRDVLIPVSAVRVTGTIRINGAGVDRARRGPVRSGAEGFPTFGLVSSGAVFPPARTTSRSSGTDSGCPMSPP